MKSRTAFWYTPAAILRSSSIPAFTALQCSGVRDFRQEMPTLGPFTKQHFRKPTRNNIPVWRGRSDKESSPSTPPEKHVKGLKSVRHTLLELSVQQFYLLLVRHRTIQMVVDHHGLTTARKRPDFTPEGVLRPRCPGRLALNAIVRVDEYHLRLGRGLQGPSKPFASGSALLMYECFTEEHGSVREDARTFDSGDKPPFGYYLAIGVNEQLAQCIVKFRVATAEPLLRSRMANAIKIPDVFSVRLRLIAAIGEIPYNAQIQRRSAVTEFPEESKLPKISNVADIAILQGEFPP